MSGRDNHCRRKNSEYEEECNIETLNNWKEENTKVAPLHL